MAVFGETIVKLRDARGDEYHFRYYVSAADIPAAVTAATAVYTALGAATNAAICRAWGFVNTNNLTPYGGTGNYQDKEDQAKLVFQNNALQLVSYTVPAPKAAMFLADGETVDPTAATLGYNLAAALAANATDKFGVTLANWLGGKRLRRRAQKKVTAWTRTPGLLPD
jgi:hypothetical protein